MTKEQFINEAKQYYPDIVKCTVRFFKKSPYQSKRYKPEFVGWEAWLYKEKGWTGYLVTEEDWSNETGRALIMDSFAH